MQFEDSTNITTHGEWMVVKWKERKSANHLKGNIQGDQSRQANKGKDHVVFNGG